MLITTLLIHTQIFASKLPENPVLDQEATDLDLFVDDENCQILETFEFGTKVPESRKIFVNYNELTCENKKKFDLRYWNTFFYYSIVHTQLSHMTIISEHWTKVIQGDKFYNDAIETKYLIAETDYCEFRIYRRIIDNKNCDAFVFNECIYRKNHECLSKNSSNGVNITWQGPLFIWFNAFIGDNVNFGAYNVVQPSTRIGSFCRIGSFNIFDEYNTIHAKGYIGNFNYFYNSSVNGIYLKPHSIVNDEKTYEKISYPGEHQNGFDYSIGDNNDFKREEYVSLDLEKA